MMPIGGESCFVIHTMKAGAVFFLKLRIIFIADF